MIKEYHADNGVFASSTFKENCALLNQKYSFSNVGAHHQNGIAEQNIKTVAQWAHANMLHFAHHWQAQANVRFWPQAIDYALWVFNRLPNLVNGLLTNKIWSSCRAPTEEFNRSHVFGCPVIVLDATLQDGHKIPKWVPRACLGVFLGFSTLHSSQIPIIMNVDMGKISPQFHVIFDDKFETVMSMTSEDSIGEQWKSIFCLKRECFEDEDYDEAGNAILPPLTSIFQQNDLVNDIVPTSPWTPALKNFASPVAPHPLFTQIPMLTKQRQKTLYQMEFQIAALLSILIQREPLNKRILLQRELLKRPWSTLIILQLLLSLKFLLIMVSLPQDSHDAMLVITSKVQQRLGVCQLMVNNMISHFQSSVSGANQYQ